MRVAVTGGSGKLGRAVVRELVEHGYDVHNVDRVVSPDDIASSTRIDLTDFGQVIEAFHGIDDLHDGVDAIVHLAAIPGPTQAGNAATFVNNVSSTFHVFSAARLLGIDRVVWASSETLLGLPFDVPPPYAPVDEELVLPTTDYSLGKAVDEELARHFARLCPSMSITGLRFSNVMEPADYAVFPSYDEDPLLRKWNLWGYIDARDGAQAVRKSLETRGPGFETYVIANADTVMSRSSSDLMREVYPDVPLRKEVGEHETLLSIDKARRDLGYDPQHSWRDER